MLVVGFAISFSRIFGGYVAAAIIGLILSFVIAVTIPASPDLIPARVGGWVLAGLVSPRAAGALGGHLAGGGMHARGAEGLVRVARRIQGMQAAPPDPQLSTLQ